MCLSSAALLHGWHAQSDARFAAAERIGRILEATQRAVAVRVLPKTQQEWSAFIATAREVLGALPPGPLVVWTGEGRVIGSLEALEQYTGEVYGVVCDLSSAQLARVAAVNDAATRADRERSALASAHAGHKRALVILGLQHDRCEGGLAEVAQAEAVVAVANTLRRRCAWHAVVTVQSWYAPDAPDADFYMADGKTAEELRRTACTAGSLGAELHPYLDVAATDVVIRCGGARAAAGDPCADSPFGGGEDGKEPTALDDVLKAAGVTQLVLVGVALEGMVAATAHDALRRGYGVVVVSDGVRAENKAAAAEATERLSGAGATVVAADGLPARVAPPSAAAPPVAPDIEV